MREFLAEEEPLYGYCKPFNTDDITVVSCRNRKKTAQATKEMSLRRCLKCVGLFVSKDINRYLVNHETGKTSNPIREGYCDHCGKHKSEDKRFHVKENQCSACYQRAWRANNN